MKITSINNRKNMKKFIKCEEVGRLAELAADYVKKTDGRKVVITLDMSYSGDKTVEFSILEARGWPTLAVTNYFLEPESATAVEALNECLAKAENRENEIQE